MATRKPAATRNPSRLSPSGRADRDATFVQPPAGRAGRGDKGTSLLPVPVAPRPSRSRRIEPELADLPPPRPLPFTRLDGARWREAARIAVVMTGVSVLLLLLNRSPLGLAIATTLDWGAYLLPPLLVAIGLDLLRRVGGDRPLLRFEEVNGLIALFLAWLIVCGSQHHGGPLGNALSDQLGAYFGVAGVPVAFTFLGALGLVLALHVTTAQVWFALRTSTSTSVRGLGIGRRHLAAGLRRGRRGLPRPKVRRVQPLVELMDDDEEVPASAQPVIEAEIVPETTTAEAASQDAPAQQSKGKRVKSAKVPAGVPLGDLLANDTSEPVAPEDPGSAWPQPSVDLLDPVPQVDSTPVDNGDRMRLIEDTLASFNVRARVVDAHSGPTVTQFDVQPERGVRVGRVTALQNDLALALAARSIRVQAPVPGRSVIGIEIPNAKTSLVTLREVLESEICTRMKSPLKIALGKDVSGGSVVADLARMPHLLIAGATGSGKSVCLNSLIACLLFHNGPDRLKLLMVDPKMVELTVFNGVPHLLTPVVTDVTKVTGTLKWALKEMHRRYKLFAEAGARNIGRYNELQTDPKGRLPFIVLIIDELADLMMVSPEDVEDGICRLAQLARATGMHLVLATQRPSVDVITGLIKANFPARIAFAVSSQVDSRTILDQVGAEKLMGRGDMLYLPSDEGKGVRVQGTYLSDKEIEGLVAFWKSNSPQHVEQIPESELAAPGKEEEVDPDDKLLNDAIRVLREYRRASVSLLQRRLSIGYTRAARLLDVLEERGIVGPSEDGRSRIVLEADDSGETGGFDGGEDDERPPL